MKNVIAFENIGLADIDQVGGKNASLGEMIQHLTAVGIKVPTGFATTSEAYQRFLSQDALDKRIYEILAGLQPENVEALAKASHTIQQWILATPFSPEYMQDIHAAYLACTDSKETAVAVRSSATAEDLPDASFAGQQETFLNISGIENVLRAIKKVYASLFTKRAISYRYHQKVDHSKVAISAGIQHMVRSDLGASGVLFTLDTESGFDKVIFITAAYGLGESIVQGTVNTDEFYVYKPNVLHNKPAILKRRCGEKLLKMVYETDTAIDSGIKSVAVPEADRMRFCIQDEDIYTLSKQALLIEKHYGVPMDIEWAKDGVDGEIYILQARPETVVSQGYAAERFCLTEKSTIKATGRSVGQRIGQGVARVILDPKDMRHVRAGDILVTDMTDPDWEPIMKLAAGIVTNRGGRTCHAAIIARELGIPAIVGCGDATRTIQEGEEITVCCAEGEAGHVYSGLLSYRVERIVAHDLPQLPVQLYLNLGNPEKAFTYQSLPNNGIGLARLEFIISNMIGIHPNAVLAIDSLPEEVQHAIFIKTAAYTSPVEFYIEKLREGISTIAAAFYPKPVIFRLSDFKTNEYAHLLGGHTFEPSEENPMLGFRGASRYVDDRFRACFELECKAFRRAREDMGLENIQIMIPFVRTVEELKKVLHLMEVFGLKRGENNLKILMMCEIPSNVLLAEAFLTYVDGFSIGSNDLTQLTLGLDRDSQWVAPLFNENDAAVKILLEKAITACNAAEKYVGICGQAPSDYPELAQWLVQKGIQSISLSPDVLIETWMYLGKAGQAHTADRPLSLLQ